MLKIVSRKLNQVHARLDYQLRRNERLLMESISRWFDFTIKQIQTDLRTKFQKDITSDLTDWEYLQEKGEEILKPATLSVMQTGGNEAYKLMQISGSFSVLNVEAVKAAGKFTADLVREVNGQTKKGIRTFIKAGIKEGKGMDRLARDIRPLVGLTENQTQSVMNYRSLLGDKEKFPKLSSDQIDGKVQRYADKTHRRRAKTIARTETARAQNMGYVTGMDNLGVQKLEFSVHWDDRLCPICAPLDKTQYLIKDAARQIPVHPNCRCAMLPVIDNTPTCRGEAGEIAKATCIMPSSLHDEHIKDLVNRWRDAKSPGNKWNLKKKLRLAGYDVEGHKLSILRPPTIKPPVIATRTVITIPKPTQIPKPVIIPTGELPDTIQILISRWKNAKSRGSKWANQNKLKQLGYDVKTGIYKPTSRTLPTLKPKAPKKPAPSSLESKMQSDEIKSVSDLGGGCNETQILRNDFKGVFKPKAGEMKALRQDIRTGTFYKREVAAYKIDQAGGFNLVPTTVIRKVKGRIGSIQEFKENGTLIGELVKTSPSAAANRQDMLFFDMLIGNSDRHRMNALLVKTDKAGKVVKNKVWAIDNGLAFPDPVLTLKDGGTKQIEIHIRNYGSIEEAGKYIPSRLRNKAVKIVRNENAIRKDLQLYLNDGEIDSFFIRARYLSKLERFPGKAGIKQDIYTEVIGTYKGSDVIMRLR